MKFKKIIPVLCALAIIGTTGVTAFAATENTTDSSNASVVSSSTCTGDQQGKHMMKGKNLTDEEKAAMKEKQAERKAQMDASKKAWEGLTDEQKEEIYALKDQSIDIQSQIIDKYLSLGIIDETKANEMKANISNMKENLRSSGKMPMGIGFGKGDKGNRGNKQLDNPTTQAEQK